MRNKTLKRAAAFATAFIMSLGTISVLPEDSFPQFSFTAFAEGTVVESGQCGDNVFYELDSEGVLTISGTGDMWDYDDYDSSLFAGNIDIKKVVIEEGITKIGNHTFESCYYITETALSNSLLSIGEEAFRYTSSLENIHIPDSVTSIGEGAFRASGITSIVIPNGITCINKDTFIMSDLITVTLPDSLVTIGEDAFSLTNIVSITLPESVKIIEDSAFLDAIVLQALIFLRV